MKKSFAISTFAWIRVAQGIIFLILLVAGALTPQHLLAQSNISGDISGTITDPSGKAVVGAQVTVKSEATAATKVATTGDSGNYRVSLLSPGKYTITATAAGFQTSSTVVAVSAGQINQQDLALAVGSGATTVEVTGSEVPLLHTEDANVTTTFDMQQVQSLPNPGNDLTFVAQTAPGAVMNTQGGYGNFAIFGLPATSNTFTVNGGYENDPFLNVNNSGATNLLLGNNDVGSVTIVSNAYGSQYGGLGGSQVNEISRSGSNKFHGDATWWWNGSRLNANDYFNNQTAIPKPRSNANQWAGSFGGPIVKDKTFFFVNTEGLRVIIPVRGTIFAPSPAYMAATLATVNPSDVAFYNTLFNVYKNSPGYATASPDATDLNAVSYSANSANFAHEWLISGRIDHRISDKDSLYGHVKIDKGVQPTFTSLLNPLFNVQSPQPEYEGQLNETHVFSPTVANQFVFAAIYYRAIFTNTNAAAANKIAPFSFQWVDGDLAGSEAGGAVGLDASLGGENFAFPQGRNVTGYQFVDDFSVTRGKHTLKAGFALRRDDVTDYGPSVLTTPLVLASEAGFQNGIADAAYIQQFPVHYDQPISLYTLGFYAQDDWKVLPNLTFTYGMRFEHNSNPVCHTNCYSTLASDFASLPTATTTPYNQLITPGLGKAFSDFQKVGYEPRVGFAYSPFGVDTHTVLRGGFGMFADSFPAQITDSLLNNAPNNLQAFVGGGALNPAAPGSNASAAAAVNSAFHANFAGGGNSSVIPPFSFYNAARKISYPMYEEWNLQIEQQIGKATSVSVNYVGNHGYHEPVVNNSANLFNGGATGFAELPTSAPNGNFGAVTQVYSGASSNYNGVILSAVRRTKSLTLQVNYVYSHALDEISNGGFNGFSGNSVVPVNPLKLSDNYGNADYDTRHYVNGSYVYNLPYYGGPRLLTDGWEVAGTVFHNNGLPFTETNSTVGSQLGNYNGGQGGLMFAKQVVPHVSTSCSGGAHVFNNSSTGPASKPCAIATEYGAATDFGQGARNQVFGPHYTDFDFTTTKSFGIPHWESARLKIGFQFFNIFNHPNFAQPAHDIGTPDNNGVYQTRSNGLVFGTVNPPTSILGSFLGGDASPRLIQTKIAFSF